MLKRKSFLMLLTTWMMLNLNAQSSGDSVKLVINKMFAAMKNADPESFNNCFADSAILQTIAMNKNNEWVVEKEDLAAFAGFIGQLKKDVADERVSFETVRTDGALAVAWVPYEFYYNGQFSHCGVNSFQLVRLRGEWKIQYLIDTRRKDGCR